MRGEHPGFPRFKGSGWGIIPACAGSTGFGETSPIIGRDHPRVRGEHVGRLTRWCSRQGSSPRARGARHLGRGDAGAAGIIPACAGSTAGELPAPCRGGDHPRVRGEHHRQDRLQRLEQGSSPRARGAQPVVDLFDPFAGIIPACAGSTSGRGRRHTTGWGSSPRARGALSIVPEALRVMWIIPACAGSTAGSAGAARTARDHPRVRGEHSPGGTGAGMIGGSSPRARGAQTRRMLSHCKPGIIPACAGSTSPDTRSGRTTGDHPRVRGEHTPRPARSCRAGASFEHFHRFGHLRHLRKR